MKHAKPFTPQRQGRRIGLLLDFDSMLTHGRKIWQSLDYLSTKNKKQKNWATTQFSIPNKDKEGELDGYLILFPNYT
jgi:hypothetical protein